MLNDFMEKVRGFILKPVETFQECKEDSLGNALTYYIILVIINAILSTLVLFAGISTLSMYEKIPGMEGIFPAVLFVGIIVGGIIGVFICGAWLHIFVWLLGGRKGYEKTLKAIMYGSTPGLLISWIPIIGIIGALWTLILEILGIQELQEMSTGRAAAAVILAVVVFVIIIIVVALVFFMAVTRVISASSYITH
ncbi:MAG: YIP1 family protein [Methanomicrobiales archaeon]